VESFYGRIKFATEGDYYHSNVGLSPLTVQIQNGVVKAVGPAKVAEAKALYPMTPWASR
jgi:branched-chain amino acid transport system substrate-binding protein